MTKRRRVVLCIERWPRRLQLIKRTLETLGYSVLTAWSGRQGRDIFLKHAGEIEAVLVARELPDGAGDQVAEEIRRLQPHVPVMLAYRAAGELTRTEGPAREMPR